MSTCQCMRVGRAVKLCARTIMGKSCILNDELTMKMKTDWMDANEAKADIRC